MFRVPFIRRRLQPGLAPAVPLALLAIQARLVTTPGTPAELGPAQVSSVVLVVVAGVVVMARYPRTNVIPYLELVKPDGMI